MRAVLSVLVKEVIDVTPHVDRRPDIRKLKANVLVLHGLKEHIDAKPFSELFEHLFRADYHVVSFNFPNHGTNVPNEENRGQVEKFWECVEIARVFVYWMLLSKKWGERPTFIVSYSFGALVAKRLLQMKFLLRKGVKGAIFIAIPLAVDHNASATKKRWLPILKPLRTIIKRIAPKMKVSEPRIDPNDPLHANGPINLRTAVEIYDATIAANVPGRIERLRELEYLAHYHGSADPIAPIKDAFAAFKRVAGNDIEGYQKERRDGIKEFHSPGGKRLFVQYDKVSHEIFEEAPSLITDIVATLDRWSLEAHAEDIFVDHRLLPLEDIVALIQTLLAHLLKGIWETKYKLRHIWKILIGAE